MFRIHIDQTRFTVCSDRKFRSRCTRKCEKSNLIFKPPTGILSKIFIPKFQTTNFVRHQSELKTTQSENSNYVSRNLSFKLKIFYQCDLKFVLWKLTYFWNSFAFLLSAGLLNIFEIITRSIIPVASWCTGQTIS